MGIKTTAAIFLGIIGGISYLNHLDTKEKLPDKKLQSKIGELNLSEIARETKPAREGLTNLTTSFWKPEVKKPNYTTSEETPIQTQPTYQNQITQPKHNPQQEVHRRRNNSNSRIPKPIHY
jgi:hypothetical protein